MNHLTDEILNEYLDDALASAARAEADAHLRGCADCAMRLEEISDVFHALASLPDVELARDLSASVVRTITPRPILPRQFQWAIALQFAAALTALIAALPILKTMFAFNVPAFPLPTVFGLMARFDQLTLSLQTFVTNIRVPEPNLSLNLSSLLITIMVGSVTLLWVVGNGLLLRQSNHSRS